VLFAKTIAQICTQNEEMYCVMAGEGPLSDAVEKHTSEHLLAPGYISDGEKWRWFNDADIFASLSAYEGMPVATLEALSCGLPGVLSDIPAHRAVIDDYDATGVCVEPSVPEVASALEEAQNKTADVSLPTWRELAEQYLTLV
jgi:glycosyltransferase involved in cell wall biosynthesis